VRLNLQALPGLDLQAGSAVIQTCIMRKNDIKNFAPSGLFSQETKVGKCIPEGILKHIFIK
jgi:hypothetical protein